MIKITREIVDPCLYNFLGYGNINGKFWFIGTEEGGAEIWRYKKLSLEESLRKRSGYSLAMDLVTVYEQYYNIPLVSFRGPSAWRYIAAFLLSFEGRHPDSKNICDYVFCSKRLRRTESQHFLCDFFPLPKKSKYTIKPYSEIWQSLDQYHNEVRKERLNLIAKNIENNYNICFIISYEKSISQLLLDLYKPIEKEICKDGFCYKVCVLNLPNKRTVILLCTPFLGQGQISYEGIRQITLLIRSMKF